ncbi:autotransporter-associated beta strand repeat-containing protein [Bradyrhizobium neotropicale]|uniref:autotransporter-associated beta strand repeat-containing protein n=1 Tax=Bradyrhizobium neotropicale TaxID=1497615 RepID=UPI0009EE80CC|nr:autotransporter-associated beta strand repeat-containing protein [Bradyrhizobium neotropicale]
MFFDASTAGSAALTNLANGEIIFMNTSAAGSSVITNNGYAVSFLDTTTAGSAAIINNSILQFADSSTADNATITNNGALGFFVNGTGGSASILNNAGGRVDFSHSSGPANDGKLSIGSIAGAGAVYLGARQLTVGGNNLSTTVSGVISDCGASGTACYANLFGLSATGGSLVKVGTGTLTLSGTNTYTGATIVNGGTLAVNGSIAFSSSLTVNSGGALGGTGVVGATTIASGVRSRRVIPWAPSPSAAISPSVRAASTGSRSPRPPLTAPMSRAPQR